ncbi:TPA: hypothetical protein ACGF2R_003510 [Vibrio cholerae]
MRLFWGVIISAFFILLYIAISSNTEIVLKGNSLHLHVNSKYDWVYQGEVISLKALFIHADGRLEDVTDMVIWRLSNDNILSTDQYGYFLGKEEGLTEIKAEIGTEYELVTSNSATIKVLAFPAICSFYETISC